MESTESLREKIRQKSIGVYRVALRLCLQQCHGSQSDKVHHGNICLVHELYELCKKSGVSHSDLSSIAFDERENHCLTESARIERQVREMKRHADEAAD